MPASAVARASSRTSQVGRSLAAAGLIDRRQGPEGRLVNRARLDDGFEEVADDTGRSDASALGELLDGALIVIPCSGRKRRGGTEETDGTSVVDWLAQELAVELLAAGGATRRRAGWTSPGRCQRSNATRECSTRRRQTRWSVSGRQVRRW